MLRSRDACWECAFARHVPVLICGVSALWDENCRVLTSACLLAWFVCLSTAAVTAAALCSTELVLDAAVPLPGSKAQPRLLQKAGVKMNVRF